MYAFWQFSINGFHSDDARKTYLARNFVFFSFLDQIKNSSIFSKTYRVSIPKLIAPPGSTSHTLYRQGTTTINL